MRVCTFRSNAFLSFHRFQEVLNIYLAPVQHAVFDSIVGRHGGEVRASLSS